LKCFETTTHTKCNKAFRFYNSDGNVNLRVPLKVLDKDGNRVNYNETSIQSSSYYDYNGQRVFLNNVALQGSTLSATVPRPVRDEVHVNVNLNDTADHYLPVQKIFTVPSSAANVHTTDELLLLTKDGKGCVGLTGTALANCWANKSL